MVSQDLQNAQRDLSTKRPTPPRSIADIAPAVLAGGKDEYVPDDDTAVTSQVDGLIKAGPVKLDTLNTSHHQVAQAVHMARRWAERKRSGINDASLVLSGPVGTGKTHIALAIWWAICEKVLSPPERPVIGEYGQPLPGYQAQPSGRFFSSNELLMRMGISRDTETGVPIAARASDIIGYPPLIVIDDVGLEQSIPFVGKDDQESERHARFFKIINHCYGNVSVIITTNLTWDELAAHIGKRAASRLTEMCPKMSGGDSFIVDMTAVPDYRRRAGGR